MFVCSSITSIFLRGYSPNLIAVPWNSGKAYVYFPRCFKVVIPPKMHFDNVGVDEKVSDIYMTLLSEEKQSRAKPGDSTSIIKSFLIRHRIRSSQMLCLSPCDRYVLNSTFVLFPSAISYMTMLMSNENVGYFHIRCLLLRLQSDDLRLSTICAFKKY